MATKIEEAPAADRLLAMSEAVARDPSELYRELLTECPVTQASDGNWIVSRYADMREILGNDGKTWFRESVIPNVISGKDEGAMRETLFVRTMAPTLLNLDPPRHTRLKRLLANAFMPSRIETRRPLVARVVAELLDRIEPLGRMEMVHDFAMPLPIRIISEMLGFGIEEEGFLESYTHVAVAMNGPGGKSPDLRAEADRLTGRFREMIGAVVEDRRAHPRDDLISEFVAAEEQGDTLSYEELIGNSIKFHIAGHETTGNLICNGVATLMQHRDQWEAICRDPILVNDAVEEILRYCGSARIVQPRKAREDQIVGGVTIPAGEQVICFPAIANRDPSVFEEPDRFDIRRKPNRHMAFGFGPHGCIGLSLARLETRVALHALATRIPNMRLDTDRVEWRRTFATRGVVALPLRW
ncbi:MAG: cytochrome P450 [Alphaproteobacteria bacterium]|nr:cytochrome P450 [Alphaproteobacteria bacterium]